MALHSDPRPVGGQAAPGHHPRPASGRSRATASPEPAGRRGSVLRGIRTLVTTDAAIATRGWPHLQPEQVIARIGRCGTTRWVLSAPSGSANWSERGGATAWADDLASIADRLEMTCDAVCHRLRSTDNPAQTVGGLQRSIALAGRLRAQRVICQVDRLPAPALMSTLHIICQVSQVEGFPLLADTAGELGRWSPDRTASLARRSGLRLCLDIGVYAAQGHEPTALGAILPAVDTIHARYSGFGAVQLPLTTREDGRYLRWWIEELHRLGCRAPITIDHGGEAGDQTEVIRRTIRTLATFQ